MLAVSEQQIRKRNRNNFAYKKTQSIFFTCCTNASMAGLKLQTCEESEATRRIRQKTVVFDETEIWIQ